MTCVPCTWCPQRQRSHRGLGNSQGALRQPGGDLAPILIQREYTKVLCPLEGQGGAERGPEWGWEIAGFMDIYLILTRLSSLPSQNRGSDIKIKSIYIKLTLYLDSLSQSL